MSIKRTGRYNDDVPAMEAEIERLTAENERLRAALADAATCSNDECHGAHVALEALRNNQQLTPQKE